MSESEKTKVVEIAVSSHEASAWLQGGSDYRTGPIDWYAIIWDSNGQAGTWWSLQYDRVANEGIPDFVSPYAIWYPGVTIAVGEGTIYQMQIAIDLDAGKAAMTMGPYPSLSSPDRFRATPLLPDKAPISPPSIQEEPAPAENETRQIFITVIPDFASIIAGMSLQYTANITGAGSSRTDIKDIIWSSDNISVAAVDKSGRVTALEPGSTAITAASGNASGRGILFVAPADLVSISIQPANPSISLGETQTFTATAILPDNSSVDVTHAVTWTSSDTGVATIDSRNHRAISCAEGSTVISAASGNIRGTATLTVTAHSWTVPEPVTTDSFIEYDSSLIQDNNGDFRCAFTGKDAIFWSKFSGTNWTPQEMITEKSATPYLIQDSDGNFLLAFSHDIGNGNYNVYWSTNSGEGWTPPVRLSAWGAFDGSPALAEDANGDLHIVFQRLMQIDSQHSGYHLFWITFHDGAWSVPVPITDQTTAEIEPSLIADSAGNLVLVFTSQTEEYGSVKMMTYSEGDWSAPTTIFSRSRREGTPWGTSLIQAKDGILWLAFAWEPTGIYVTNNSNGTWSTPSWAVMPTPDIESSNPSLIQDEDGHLWISFRYWDHVTDREIYWTRSREPK